MRPTAVSKGLVLLVLTRWSMLPTLSSAYDMIGKKETASVDGCQGFISRSEKKLQSVAHHLVLGLKLL